MLKVKEVIVVEGKFDKNTVAQVVDATIIETSGFGVFSDKEKLSLLKKLADIRGLIILTDSDGAGFFIRGRLRGLLDGHNIINAYIPDVPGYEKRKRALSKEGKIGVEGMSPEIIKCALLRAGATLEDENDSFIKAEQITKADMFALGLSGSAGSFGNRASLLARLGLPSRLSANSMLEVLNILFNRDEFYELMNKK